MMFQVQAPHYCACLVVAADGVVIEAAPILKWAIGKQWAPTRNYFLRKGFKIEDCSP